MFSGILIVNESIFLCESKDDLAVFISSSQRSLDILYEVELVDLPVLRRVRQRNRLRLDGDAAFAFDRVRIEHLRFHLAVLQAAA